MTNTTIWLSEYTIIDKVSQAVDPLGLMRPAGALRDLLFPQFTVLTHHPAYLGLLCALLSWLEAHGKRNLKDLPLDFRRLEILWGTAVSLEERPLNVTKFNRLLEQFPDGFRLGDVSRNHLVLKRLGYGTLGHYSRPAMTWQLVQPKTFALTSFGRDLAKGFTARGTGWTAAFDAWASNKPVELAEMQRFGKAFGLQAHPSTDEAKTWRSLITHHGTKHPAQSVLWDTPLPAKALEIENPQSYQNYWKIVRAQYPSLKATLDVVYLFERVTSALQLLFFHRVARGEREGTAAKAPASLMALAPPIVELAQRCQTQQAFVDARNLVATVANASPSLPAIERCLIDHHISHNTAKGAAPFIDHGGVKVRGRVEWGHISQVVDALDTGPDAALDYAQYVYGRDWQFGKCRLWYDHANFARTRP